MAVQIDFVDATGSGSLVNVTPRYAGWTPSVKDVGPAAASMGTGVTYHTIFRRDYYATFKINNIRQSKLSVAIRLKAHLENGNSCVVQTGDVSSSIYYCVMKPEEPPAIDYTDPKNLEYTMTLNVLNSQASPMIVQYTNV